MKEKHSHDVDVDVRTHSNWRSLINIVRVVGYPVMLLRLNADRRPEGIGSLTETDEQYRKIIEEWLRPNEPLHIRIVPGQIVKS